MSYSVSVSCKEYYLKKKSPLKNALFIKHASALKNTLKYYVWFKRAWLRLHGLGCRLLSESMSSKEEPRCWLRLEQREGGHSQMEPLASCLLWDHHVWSSFANVGTWSRASTQLGFLEQQTPLSKAQHAPCTQHWQRGGQTTRATPPAWPLDTAPYPHPI